MKQTIRRTLPAILFFLMAAPSLLSAQVAVGVIPFKGEGGDPRALEAKVRELLVKTKGVVVVADSMMKDIVKIHEQAMASGTAYHDISKLRVAEFIITGSLAGNSLTVKAVDVNTTGEVFNMTVDLSSARDYQIRKVSRELQNAIITSAGSKNRNIPADAKPYMALVKDFIAALPQGDQACWKYLAFYHAGSYQRPVKESPGLTSQAKVFLDEVRPELAKTTVTYFGIEQGSPFIFLTVFAERTGKRSKHKFGIMEMNDGSLAIGSYEPAR
ncbi:MAG TPA: hypothetical protein PKM65_13585 [Spirochaetota bacterium]|nr:hypothetical protein [Spirochaetota bacterium]HNT11097.1 hypothetical protein [Spirochaetota bacterium]HOS40972.1 hypothetical protein [Spirochaetota bacterium]HPU90094.1 hypothetical protein [Spirochaetota bacterium]